jgi:protein MpaA
VKVRAVRPLDALAAVSASAALLGIAGCGTAAKRRHRDAPMVEPTAAVATSARRVITIGHSIRGRPIRAVLVGDPRARRAVLVVGCIHGNEQAGIAIAKLLAAGSTVPAVALWIVPVLNPDGVAADTRQNADGVDLNRNFPYRWRRLGTRGYLQYSGPHALSEPESRAAHRLILRIRSGGTAGLERRYARLVGLRVMRLLRYPGSAVGWENHVLPSTTAFVVELPPGRSSTRTAARYAAAVVDLLNTSGHPTNPRAMPAGLRRLKVRSVGVDTRVDQFCASKEPRCQSRRLPPPHPLSSMTTRVGNGRMRAPSGRGKWRCASPADHGSCIR